MRSVVVPGIQNGVVNVIGSPTVGVCPLLFEAGCDETGAQVEIDLADTPHMLVAGMTGSGKSTFVTLMLTELLTRYSPDQMRVVLIDPKRVELAPFKGAAQVLSFSYEIQDSIDKLYWLCVEMERRYDVLSLSGVRKIEEVLAMPRIVVVAEELASLMLSGRRKEVEPIIARLSSMGRAVGIHLVLITQRPSVDVITGVIKANVPARVALATVTAIDSRVILDQQGAEDLAGKGDMLVSLPQNRNLVRLQGRQATDLETRYAATKIW